MLPSLVIIDDPAPVNDLGVEGPPPAEPVNGKAHKYKARNTQRKFSKEQIFHFFRIIDEKECSVKELSEREGFGRSTYDYWRRTMFDEYSKTLGAAAVHQVKGTKKRGGRKKTTTTVSLTDKLRDLNQKKIALWAEADKACAAITDKANADAAVIDQQILALVAIAVK